MNLCYIFFVPDYRRYKFNNRYTMTWTTWQAHGHKKMKLYLNKLFQILGKRFWPFIPWLKPKAL